MAKSFDIHRLLAIARKESIQLRRDPRSLLLAFMLPAFLLVVFGYAISWDIRDIRLLVIDHDRSAQSRSFIEAFTSSGYFTIAGQTDDPRDIEDSLDRGDAELVIIVPPDFSRELGGGRNALVQAVLDGSDANTATIIAGYTQAVVMSWSAKVILDTRDIHMPLVAESRVWFNEELTSRNMIVPGLVAVIMMVIAAMLTSLTIAREWERGTMEQLASTPVSRLEVVLGKLLPYVAIGLVDIVGVSVIGVMLFKVPFRGNPFLLMILSFFFILGALGLGVFISAVAKTQVVATQIAMVVTFLPGFLLSGFMFAIEVMPQPLRSLTYLIPARYFLVVTRGIFLKGVGVEVLRTQGLLMIAFAAIGLFLATVKFRKELE